MPQSREPDPFRKKKTLVRRRHVPAKEVPWRQPSGSGIHYPPLSHPGLVHLASLCSAQILQGFQPRSWSHFVWANPQCQGGLRTGHCLRSAVGGLCPSETRCAFPAAKPVPRFPKQAAAQIFVAAARFRKEVAKRLDCEPSVRSQRPLGRPKTSRPRQNANLSQARPRSFSETWDVGDAVTRARADGVGGVLLPRCAPWERIEMKPAVLDVPTLVDETNAPGQECLGGTARSG